MSNWMPRKAPRGAARLLGGEAGFSLIELLAVMSGFVVVMLSLFGFYNVTDKVARREIAAGQAARAVQVGLHRMTRELRQASTIYAASASTMDVKIAIAGVPTRVVYKCDVQPSGVSYRQCVRAASTTLTAAPSTGSAPVIVDRVLNGTAAAPSNPGVFSFTPDAINPTFVQATVVVPANAGGSTGYSRNITLDDGFYPRNLGTQ